MGRLIFKLKVAMPFILDKLALSLFVHLVTPQNATWARSSKNFSGFQHGSD